MVTVADLVPGERARVKQLNVKDKNYKRQLLAMGLTPNAIVSIVRIAPLGDPIQIQVRDFYLSLRRGEAAQIEVETIHD